MGIFGAVPATVTEAISAGSVAVAVEVGGTLMSFVPDTIRDSPQVWWTRLGSFVETEGLIPGRHARTSGAWKLSRIRFTDYLPGAKVLIWESPRTVFIYVRHGLGKRESAAAVRAALRAAGHPRLSAAHAGVVTLVVAAASVHVPMWAAHWSVPKGTVAATGASVAAAAVFGASALISQWPHADHVPPAGAIVGPVSAQPVPPHLAPAVSRTPAAPASDPSVYVQPHAVLSPSQVPSIAPVPLPTRTKPAAPAPVPRSAPAPLPSSEVPYPVPSSIGSDPAPTGLWGPSPGLPLW